MNIWFVKPVLDLFWILFLFLIGLWGFFKDSMWKGRGKTLTWFADLIAVSIMDLRALLNKIFGLLAIGLCTSYLLGVRALITRVVFEKRNYKISFFRKHE